MSLIVIGSAKGSPGATSLAAGLSLAWQTANNRPALLLEADSDGGILAARFGLATTPSLIELAGKARHELSLQSIQSNCQPLAKQVQCLIAPGCGYTTSRLLSSLAERLANGFKQFHDVDAIVDIGRIRANSPTVKFVEHCDLAVIVARPEFEQLVPLVHLARCLKDRKPKPTLVCIGDRPYPPTEIAKSAGLNLLGVMAYDARVSHVLAAGHPENNRQRRLLLWRTLGELAARIHNHAAPQNPVKPVAR